MSEPAADPGSDADTLYGMDRRQALAQGPVRGACIMERFVERPPG
ncbi:MAG TPA: hypothetical protein VGI66_08305 [Streptosporangiaceae bacterium]